MIYNYLKIALRNISKYKLHSFINILGLSAGLICAIFIMLWVHYELSFDTYYANAENISLAYLKGIQEDRESFQSTTSPAIAVILKNEFPEITNAARAGRLGDIAFRTEDKLITESFGIAADPEFLQIFGFNYLHGNAQTALANPNAMILTKSLSEKYFDQENSVGKTITLHNKFDFYVSAVIEDIPPNVNRLFEFIVPFVFLKEIGKPIEGSNFYPCIYHTYVSLRDNVNYSELDKKVNERIFSEGKEIKFEIALIPLLSLHLKEGGGLLKIYIFSLIAVLVLLVACFNFMNITIARSLKKSKEIGIRKVIGARRKQLIFQVLGESIFISFIAILIAIICVELLLPYFNTFTQAQITIEYFNSTWLLEMILLIFLTGIIAGSYPAFFLSSFNPVKVLKSGQQRLSSKSSFRKVLLVSQFIVAISFIIATVIMNRQLHYIKNFDLGMDEENIYYVNLSGDAQNKNKEIKTELLRNPNIESVTSASLLPVAITSGSYRIWGKEENQSRRICEIFVEYDFLNTFGIKMADGRFYSEKISSDPTDAIIVNEAAIRTLGGESFTGKPFYYVNRYNKLIGVIKDFQHISPIFSPPQPVVLHLKSEGNPFLFARINPNIKDVKTIQETTKYIRNVCNSFSPDFPLSYSFLSDFDYSQERIIAIRQRLILYASVFAIFISCIGLFGLSAFLNEQRTKEIGIRKVVGASNSNLLTLLTKDFTKWVIIANIFAWPLSWFLMTMWLQNFAYRIQLQWWVFVLCSIFILFIAFLTVGIQALKSAFANPVKSLRYE